MESIVRSGLVSPTVRTTRTRAAKGRSIANLLELKAGDGERIAGCLNKTPLGQVRERILVLDERDLTFQQSLIRAAIKAEGPKGSNSL